MQRQTLDINPKCLASSHCVSKFDNIDMHMSFVFIQYKDENKWLQKLCRMKPEPFGLNDSHPREGLANIVGNPLGVSWL